MPVLKRAYVAWLDLTLIIFSIQSGPRADTSIKNDSQTSATSITARYKHQTSLLATSTNTHCHILDTTILNAAIYTLQQ